jgi:hypothetical protein
MCEVKKTTFTSIAVWCLGSPSLGCWKPIQTEAKRYYHLQQGVQVMIFSVEKLHELVVSPPAVSIWTLPFEPKKFSEDD